MVNFNKINVNANKVQTGKVAGGNGDLQVKNFEGTKKEEYVAPKADFDAISKIANEQKVNTVKGDLTAATLTNPKEEVGGKE